MEELASPIRGPAGPVAPAEGVAAELFDAAHHFDFYQAVALLHRMRPDAIPVGFGSDPGREPVRFSSSISLRFPASDIEQLQDGQPAQMLVALMGLAGAQGPLPRAVTEVILARVARKDTAFRAFLDLFNHRLVSLHYRVRAENRIGLAPEQPHRTRAAKYLYAFAGLGTPHQQGRAGLPDRSLLGHIALLAGTQRSQTGLESILASHFGVAAKVRPYRGRWLPIDREDQSGIGRSGRNRSLGRETVLGGRVWDMQSCFTIALGPLDYQGFNAFLPISDRFQPLVAIARFYFGEEYDFDIELLLKPEAVTQAKLSATDGARIGWNAWIGRAQAACENGPVTVTLAGRRDARTVPGDAPGLASTAIAQ